MSNPIIQQTEYLILISGLNPNPLSSHQKAEPIWVDWDISEWCHPCTHPHTVCIYTEWKWCESEVADTRHVRCGWILPISHGDRRTSQQRRVSSMWCIIPPTTSMSEQRRSPSPPSWPSTPRPLECGTGTISMWISRKEKRKNSNSKYVSFPKLFCLSPLVMIDVISEFLHFCVGGCHQRGAAENWSETKRTEITREYRHTICSRKVIRDSYCKTGSSWQGRWIHFGGRGIGLLYQENEREETEEIDIVNAYFARLLIVSICDRLVSRLCLTNSIFVYFSISSLLIDAHVYGYENRQVTHR